MLSTTPGFRDKFNLTHIRRICIVKDSSYWFLEDLGTVSTFVPSQVLSSQNVYNLEVCLYLGNGETAG